MQSIQLITITPMSVESYLGVQKLYGLSQHSTSVAAVAETEKDLKVISVNL